MFVKKNPDDLTLQEVTSMCSAFKLEPAVTEKVVTGFINAKVSPENAVELGAPDVPERPCPAFGQDSVCRGNACGMECESLVL